MRRKQSNIIIYTTQHTITGNKDGTTIAKLQQVDIIQLMNIFW